MTGEQLKPPMPVHAFLTRHKIIFETVAAVALTIASVLVAYLQWRTAQRQADISLRQVQPNFVISVHQIMREGETSFTEEEMHVQNFGGPAHELNSTITTWYQVKGSTSGKPFEQFTVNLPVNNYYHSNYIRSDTVSGMLVRAVGNRNNEKMTQLEREVAESARSAGFDTCLLSLEEYIRLDYLDLFDQRHTEYFHVWPTIGARRISQEEGRQWVDDFNKRLDERGIQFGRTTAGQIIERVKSALPKSQF